MKKVADGKKFTYRNYKVLIISLDKKYASLTYILQLQSKHRFLLILWNRLTKAEIQFEKSLYFFQVTLKKSDFGKVTVPWK